MGLSLIEASSFEPITVAQVKTQARVSDNDTEDDWIDEVVIPSTRERAELATNRQMLLTKWALSLDRVPSCGWIEIPKPPLVGVVSFTYVDTAGVTQTWASSNYVVSAPAGPRCKRGRLALAYGSTWPVTQSRIDAVTITFTAGYGSDPEDVPAMLRGAMLSDAASMYGQREDIVIGTIVAKTPRSAEMVYRSYRSDQTQVLQ